MSSSRRKFLKEIGSAAILSSITAWKAFGDEEKIQHRKLLIDKKISSIDKIRIACIGFGIMGLHDVKTALQVPGTELTGVCDLYKGRLERARELYGNNLFITQDYRELIDRKDIDAIILATSDHWHDVMSIESMKKGKAVYCEKPMVHQLSQGLPVINAEKETKSVFQVGSQRVSSVLFSKAKELYKSGEIGQLNCIEAYYDRQSSLGAWQYTMPTDASINTVAWDKYLRTGTKRPFDAKQFFWWRNYKEFGTGVAGDLFVHLLSGIHFLTDSKGPNKIFSTGQLSYWKDGRDVPDIMMALMDYSATKQHPAFQVMLRVNFISGLGDKSVTHFIGTEGAFEFGWNGFKVHYSKMPKAPGYGGWDALDTYPEAEQKRIIADYERKYIQADRTAVQKNDAEFNAPAGYDERLDHFINFFNSMRAGLPVIENASFGFRAAAPCLACNDSYFQKKIIRWDPDDMKVV